MSIAIGGRIEHQQHSFGAIQRASRFGIRAAILRAEIDGRIVRAAAAIERCELRRAVVRKEDIVADERRVADIARQRDGEGRIGAILRPEPRQPAGRSEPSIGERGCVRRDDDSLRIDRLPAGERDARYPPTIRTYSFDMRVVNNARAAALCTIGERIGNPLHPAFDQPDALALDMRDER